MAAARTLLSLLVFSLVAVGECGHRYYYEVEQALRCGGKPYTEAVSGPSPFFS